MFATYFTAKVCKTAFKTESTGGVAIAHSKLLYSLFFLFMTAEWIRIRSMKKIMIALDSPRLRNNEKIW